MAFREAPSGTGVGVGSGGQLRGVYRQQPKGLWRGKKEVNFMVEWRVAVPAIA